MASVLLPCFAKVSALKTNRNKGRKGRIWEPNKESHLNSCKDLFWYLCWSLLFREGWEGCIVGDRLGQTCSLSIGNRSVKQVCLFSKTSPCCFNFFPCFRPFSVFESLSELLRQLRRKNALGKGAICHHAPGGVLYIALLPTLSPQPKPEHNHLSRWPSEEEGGSRGLSAAVGDADPSRNAFPRRLAAQQPEVAAVSVARRKGAPSLRSGSGRAARTAPCGPDVPRFLRVEAVNFEDGFKRFCLSGLIRLRVRKKPPDACRALRCAAVLGRTWTLQFPELKACMTVGGLQPLGCCWSGCCAGSPAAARGVGWAKHLSFAVAVCEVGRPKSPNWLLQVSYGSLHGDIALGGGFSLV